MPQQPGGASTPARTSLVAALFLRQAFLLLFGGILYHLIDVQREIELSSSSDCALRMSSEVLAAF